MGILTADKVGIPAFFVTLTARLFVICLYKLHTAILNPVKNEESIYLINHIYPVYWAVKWGIYTHNKKGIYLFCFYIYVASKCFKDLCFESYFSIIKTSFKKTVAFVSKLC